MITLKKVILGALSLLSIFAVQPVNAALITDASSLTGAVSLIDFSEFTGSNQHQKINGPVNIGTPIGEDIQASATTDSPDLSLTNTLWDLGTSGQWDTTRNGFLGIFSNSVANDHPIKISFDSANISGFGFFINAYNAGPIILKAFGKGDTSLEEHTIKANGLPSAGSDNDGVFKGIQRANADIEFITISGYRAVFDDLQFTRTVPEPSSILLLMLGLAGIGASVRNSKRAH